MAGWLEMAQDAANAISGGIDGYLGGTDGGTVNAQPVKNEEVLRDQSQQDKRTDIAPVSTGMSTKTMLMIGGGLAVLVLVVVMVKK